MPLYPAPSATKVAGGLLDTKSGAHNQIRTGDLFLTKEVLYLLSYMSVFHRARWSG